MYNMINIINTAVCYMKIVRRVILRDLIKRKTFFSFSFIFIYMRGWMFTKLIVLITS